MKFVVRWHMGGSKTRSVNCSVLGGLGSSLHLLRRELGSLTCLRMALAEHGPSMYSMSRTACQPDLITSIYYVVYQMLRTPMGAKNHYSLVILDPLGDATSCVTLIAISAGWCENLRPQTWKSCALATSPRQSILFMASIYVNFHKTDISYI